MADKEKGMDVPRTVCSTDPNHPSDNIKEWPECHRLFCPPCFQSHRH